MTITFTDKLSVDLTQHVGGDNSVVVAARVSTGLDLENYDEAKNKGLINYLIKNRHGSPFEHNSMTFRVSAPIFVFREYMRHRVLSFNEESGRYMKLEPKFYVYPAGRPLVQSGSSAHPKLIAGSYELFTEVSESTQYAYSVAWGEYERMIEAGAAKEVARAVLPVGIFSNMYVTMNARSMMHFLSLRVDAGEASTFPTKPQWEIEQVALQLEEHFKTLFPITWAAFNKHGRVSP